MCVDTRWIGYLWSSWTTATPITPRPGNGVLHRRTDHHAKTCASRNARTSSVKATQIWGCRRVVTATVACGQSSCGACGGPSGRNARRNMRTIQPRLLGILPHPLSLATMTHPLNGHCSSESTTSVASAANQGFRYPPGRPTPMRSTSEGRLDMGHIRPQTVNQVNRRSGGFLASGNGVAPESDIEHRATWAGSEHTWQQGYHVRPAHQLAHGRADLRANRLREAQWHSGGPSANGSALQAHTNGPRAPAEAPLTDESAFLVNGSASVGHAPSAKPVSRRTHQR